MTARQDRAFSNALLSLRGLAALSVCLYHVALIFPAGGWANQAILWTVAGPSAVMFFFVHSGFVLALRFGELNPLAIGRFYLRRFFRLWPMIAVSCVMATGYIALGGTAQVPDGTSPWYQALMRGSAADLDFWRNLWLSRNGLNWFFWSLAVEVVGSLLLPGVVALYRRAWPLQTLALIGFFLVAAAPLWGGSDDIRRMEWVGAIMVGAALAYAPILLARQWRPLAVILSIAALVLARHFLPILTAVAVETAASAIIVQAVYHSRWRLLEARPLVYLGSISYSFYINSLLSIHIATKIALLLTSPGPMATVVTALLAVALNLALSAVTYQLIERPGIALGRRLSPVAHALTFQHP